MYLSLFVRLVSFLYFLLSRDLTHQRSLLWVPWAHEFTTFNVFISLDDSYYSSCVSSAVAGWCFWPWKANRALPLFCAKKKTNMRCGHFRTSRLNRMRMDKRDFMLDKREFIFGRMSQFWWTNVFFGPVCEMFAPLGKHFMFVAEEKRKRGRRKGKNWRGGRTYVRSDSS